jgi:hypothetical protein
VVAAGHEVEYEILTNVHVSAGRVSTYTFRNRKFRKKFPTFACGQSVDGGVSRMRFLGYEGLLRGITILQVPYERNALRSEARVGTFR